MQFLEEEPFNSFSCVSYHEKPKKMKTGKRGITKRETNSTRSNLKKITTKKAVHKKQNTISNNNAFKILTSPRMTKQNTKVLSSRMKVINLNKDHKLKRKLKDSKQKEYIFLTNPCLDLLIPLKDQLRRLARGNIAGNLAHLFAILIMLQ